MTRILVVDDDEIVRESLQRQLKAHGYSEVETTVDGVEALKKATESPFDLIVSDENMPNMGGVLLLEKLRQQGSTVPVILIGGYIDKGRVEKLKREGFAAVLGKPFPPRELIQAIKAILG